MGNFSTSTNVEVSILHKLSTFKKTIHHKFYGECDIYSLGQQLIACKRLVKEKSDEFKPSYGCQAPHVIRYFGQRDEYPTMCGGHCISTYFYEYNESSLADSIQAHIKNETLFKESDIWLIFLSIVKLGSHLQSLQQFHSDLRPETLQYTQSGQIKSIPLGTFPKKFGYLDGYTHAMQTGEPTYLSPELLQSLSDGYLTLIENHVNRYKADIYSLGLTLLDCMTLKCSKGTYNFSDFEVYWELLDARIEDTKASYSKILCNILSGLLSTNPENRPDFIQLDLMLKPYESFIHKKQPFQFSLLEAKYALKTANNAQTQRFVKRKEISALRSNTQELFDSHAYEQTVEELQQIDTKIPSFDTQPDKIQEFQVNLNLHQINHQPLTYSLEQSYPQTKITNNQKLEIQQDIEYNFKGYDDSQHQYRNLIAPRQLFNSTPIQFLGAQKSNYQLQTQPTHDNVLNSITQKEDLIFIQKSEDKYVLSKQLSQQSFRDIIGFDSGIISQRNRNNLQTTQRPLIYKHDTIKKPQQLLFIIHINRNENLTMQGQLLSQDNMYSSKQIPNNPYQISNPIEKQSMQKCNLYLRPDEVYQLNLLQQRIKKVLQNSNSVLQHLQSASSQR